MRERGGIPSSSAMRDSNAALESEAMSNNSKRILDNMHQIIGIILASGQCVLVDRARELVGVPSTNRNHPFLDHSACATTDPA